MYIMWCFGMEPVSCLVPVSTILGKESIVMSFFFSLQANTLVIEWFYVSV